MGSKEKQFAPNRDPDGKIKPFRVKVEAREICYLCYSVIRVGYEVPVDDWFRALPKSFQKESLCLNCFLTYADRARIRWDKRLRFFPVSLATRARG